MNTNIRHRNPGIDLVRGVGVLAIVAGHVWLDDPANRLLFAWHVPVFFFLSGYLWKRRTIREELKARARSLLKPYAFWFAVLFALFLWVTLASRRATPGVVMGPVYGGAYATQPFSTFWFVFVLFLATILWQALKHGPRWLTAVILIAAALATVFTGPLLARTPLAIGTALPALVFLAAGTWLRGIEHRIRSKIWVALVALAASFVLTAVGVISPVDIKSGCWGTPILSVLIAIAISWSLVLLASAACARASRAVDRLITGFALCGFTIVLAHPAVLWLLSGVDLGNVLAFAAAVLIPALISLAAQRSTLSQWVTGVPPRAAGSARPATAH